MNYWTEVLLFPISCFWTPCIFVGPAVVFSVISERIHEPFLRLLQFLYGKQTINDLLCCNWNTFCSLLCMISRVHVRICHRIGSTWFPCNYPLCIGEYSTIMVKSLRLRDLGNVSYPRIVLTAGKHYPKDSTTNLVVTKLLYPLQIVLFSDLK